MEVEIKILNNLLIEKSKLIANLEVNLSSEKDEKVDIIHELEKYRQEVEEERSGWAEENSKLKKEIETLNEIMNTTHHGYGSVRSTASNSSGSRGQLDEITRLTTENLDLQDKNDILNENVRKLTRQLKILNKKLKENGLDLADADFNFKEQKDPEADKHIEYIGMFSFKTGDEGAIMKQLVIELEPTTALTLRPGLPAYIVFMCVRHTDHINDKDKTRALLSSFANTVREVIKKRHEDSEILILWLSNTLKLMQNIKQYSVYDEFKKKNTPKQNEQYLRNHNIIEYCQVLTDLAVWICTGLCKSLMAKMQPLIVPAIIEHKEIPSVSGNKPGSSRGRANRVARDLESPIGKQKPTDALLQELTYYDKLLNSYGVDPEVISQIFRQLFYYLCATSLNKLLLRKQLCHWSKGTQIIHNLSHFEMWTKEKKLDEAAVLAQLKPIIQAAQLLQARKSDKDVDSVCEMCSALTPLQIYQILNRYTVVDDYEQRVPLSFKTKVRAKLQDQTPNNDQQSLLMDTELIFPLLFPYNPSDICLEGIDIPEVLKLPMLEKI